jgi:spore coat polysaccharide biosynthesis protein SpsF (cytidylyltransferase family)
VNLATSNMFPYRGNWQLSFVQLDLPGSCTRRFHAYIMLHTEPTVTRMRAGTTESDLQALMVKGSDTHTQPSLHNCVQPHAYEVYKAGASDVVQRSAEAVKSTRRQAVC